MRKLCLIKALAAAQIASCLSAKHVVDILSWWLGLSCPAVGALFGSRRLQLLTKWPAAIGRSGCKQGHITAKAWLQIWPAFLWQRWLPTLDGVATNLASARRNGYKDRNDWLAKMYRLQQVQKLGKRNHNNPLWIMFCQPKGSDVQRSLHELRIVISSQFPAAYSYWFGFMTSFYHSDAKLHVGPIHKTADRPVWIFTTSRTSLLHPTTSALGRPDLYGYWHCSSNNGCCNLRTLQLTLDKQHWH